MPKFLVYIVCGILIILISCKKETEDNIKPSINITSPSNSQFYTALDTIHIKGIVSDETIIESIAITLNNSNNIAVAPSVHLTPNVKERVLDEIIVIDNINLEGGQYHLHIAAKDGINTTNKFIDIYINEYPRRRRGVFVFSNSGSTTLITKVDSFFNSLTHSTVAGDFLGGYVNSQEQEVISCGNFTGDLKGIEISSGLESWTINNASSLSSYFTGLAVGENEIFISNYDRNIQSYIGSGTPNFNAQSLVNSHSTLAYVHDQDLLITEQKTNVGSTTNLVAYYLSTGIEKQNLTLNEDIISMFSRSSNEVVLFTNSGGNGTIKIFDINQNSTWQPFLLNSGQIDCCTEISLGVYAISQNGDLTVIDVNNYTNTLYLSGINATNVKYDELTNQLFVVNGLELSVYDYSSKTKMTSYINSEAILDFDFWYNK